MVLTLYEEGLLARSMDLAMNQEPAHSFLICHVGAYHLPQRIINWIRRNNMHGAPSTVLGSEQCLLNVVIVIILEFLEMESNCILNFDFYLRKSVL